jgi:nucleoside-diphosphate-sugar epimerase
MRVLVTGAAGFLGRSVVAAFASGPHDVRALVRTPAQAQRLSAGPAHAVLGDLLDPATLPEAVKGCDLVIHLAQSSSDSLDERRAVRVGGVRNLIPVMASVGVRRLLVGSGYWVYSDDLGVISEGSQIAPVSISRINFEAEEAARQQVRRGGLEVVVVRPGMVYGDGSWFRQMVDELRAGSYRYVAPGENYLSPIHVEDAGQAFRRVAEEWHAGETYLAVDDRPETTRGFAEFVAAQLQSPPPRAMPRDEAERAWGADLVRLNVASRQASNVKLKGLGWRPNFRSYQDGVPAVLQSMGSTSPAT